MNRQSVGLLLILTLGFSVPTGAIADETPQTAKTNTKSEEPKTRVTIDVKDTDINRVLDAFSQQTGLSLVVGKEVTGVVSVRIYNVPWDQALDAILKPYGFGAEQSGDVIVVLPIKQLKELGEMAPLRSPVFKLK